MPGRIPRGFCGYICPLGTVIDLFDWAIGRRVNRWKLKDQNRGWWVHLKYYLLLGCLVAALFGVLLTGFVAAIPSSHARFCSWSSQSNSV